MILVLTGATGTGKSRLALALAELYQGEIINADAFQVYQELTIATAAPTEAMKRLCPHHLYQFVPLGEGYDVARYQVDCRKALSEVLARGHTPILVGGAGLYIRSALYDYDFSIDTSKVDLSPYAAFSDEALHAELAKRDPTEAEKIPYQNRRRVERALALCLALGTSKTAFLATQTHQPIYPARFFALTEERDALYPLVEKRVDAMFEAGLVEETKPLIEKYGRSAPAFQAIGVKELFPYLDGKASLEETKNLIKEKTRHYVKSQETFFRHQFSLEYVGSLGEIVEALKK
jgi:tRNA dimethylallyltransferase